MKAKGLGIFSAVTSSICCIGPPLLILAGLGGLGFGAVIGKYHWYFIIGAALLLSLAWGTFFKEKKSCETKHCEMEGKKMTRNILILASLVVFTFVGLNVYTYAKESPISSIAQTGVQISIPVEGMTCFTCETAVRKAVKKLPGIHDVKASAKDKLALVSYDPEKTSLDSIVGAINSTGFKAKKPKI